MGRRTAVRPDPRAPRGPQACARCEAEVVAMTASLLGGGEGTGVCGNMTAGGTESILLAVKAARDHARAAREAESKLDAVMQEKNAVERVLEEMERAKANMTIENRELRDSVTVLKGDLNHAAEHHQLVVRKWRDELVTYREKSPQEFLAEVIGLVSDMDNEVTIEVIPPEAKAAEKTHEEVRLEECEWAHNPRLAVTDSTRLLMLANSGRTVTETKENAVRRVQSVKPVASPKRATTPTRAALGKLTNTGVQRATNVAHKAAQLVQAAPPVVSLNLPAAQATHEVCPYKSKPYRPTGHAAQPPALTA